ncbi:MAG: diguanylate cyclase [Thermoleophilia bacterium]
MTEAWGRAARRLRALQLAQLAAVITLAVMAALAAAVTARQLGDMSSGRDRADAAVTRLSTVKDDLRGIQGDFLRRKVLFPEEKALTPEVMRGVLADQAKLIALEEELRAWAPGDVRAAGTDALAAIADLGSMVTANLGTAARSDRAIDAVRRLDRVVTRIDVTTKLWLDALRRVRDHEDARMERLRADLVQRVAVGAGLLAIAAVLLWMVLDRARARVVAALRTGAEEQHAQGRLATAVAEGADLARIAEVAAEEARRVLSAGAAAVAVADHGAPVVLSAAGEPPAALHAALARAIATGEPARIDAAPGRRTGDDGGADAPAFAVPVSVDGVRWGAVAAALAPGAPGEDAAERLVRVSATLALAVGSVESRRRLTREASCDPLTGLANHREFRDRLAREMARARAEGREVALALIDIDHFKAVNDGLGHQAGDGVLSEVARRIRAQAREHDVVARVGGEEFAWLMPGADGMAAFAAAERARLAVRGGRMGDVALVTVSAGVATSADTEDPDELMRLADTALYWSKENGRDLCCRWSPDLVTEAGDDDRDAGLARRKALAAIQALARAVDARDPYTLRHSERVAELTHRLAVAAGWDPARAVLLREAALLHDVGKVGVPDAVLLKPSPLTDEEFGRVREHAALGAQIVAGVLDPEQVAWVRAHHERFDGDGYPAGLAGGAIPEGARLMAVADAFDAMTTDRPYRPGCDAGAAVASCLLEAGGQLCPDAVVLLHDLWREGQLPLQRLGATA